MIDNKYQIETAEGIDIDLVPAGIAVRTYAFIIDFSIRLVILFTFGIITNAIGAFGMGLLFIAIFVVEWFYPVLFEIYKGATPGKSALGLRVVYDNGLPVSFAGSLTRNLFRTIDFLPFCYLIGAISMVLNQQSKRLGDIVAGTTVVYANKKPSQSTFSFIKQTYEMPIMSTEEQQLVVSFAHRTKDLSMARQIELASVLSPVLKVDGAQAVARIKSMAAVIVGKI